MLFQLDGTYNTTTSYDHSDVACTSHSTGYLCDYVTVFEADEFENNGLDQETVEEIVEDEIFELVRFKMLFVVYSKIYRVLS